MSSKWQVYVDKPWCIVDEHGALISKSTSACAAMMVREHNAHHELVEAIKLVRSIIMDGAPVGFNPLDGDWADRLYASQGVTFKALEAAGVNPRTALSQAREP